MLCDEQDIALILHVHIFEIGDPSASNAHAKIDEARQRKREVERHDEMQ